VHGYPATLFNDNSVLLSQKFLYPWVGSKGTGGLTGGVTLMSQGIDNIERKGNNNNHKYAVINGKLSNISIKLA